MGALRDRNSCLVDQYMCTGDASASTYVMLVSKSESESADSWRDSSCQGSVQFGWGFTEITVQILIAFW